MDYNLSLGEGFRIESRSKYRSRALLSLLTSSSLQLTEEEREEKRRSREMRTKKRMESRKRMPAKANSKEETLAVAADLEARAIASASQSAALSGALLKIQKLQMHAAVKPHIIEAPPVFAAPIPRMNPTSFQPLLRQIQSDPIIFQAEASRKSPTIDPLFHASDPLMLATTSMMNSTNFHAFLNQTKSELITPNAMTSSITVNPSLEIPAKKAKTLDLMTQMPSVKARGDGPNGRQIEGFLSQWLNGQVVIVCHCHGSFLTPTEFVQHAGCTDVANPMRHITVCFSP